MCDDKVFYTYLWLRHDGTPYYVGKGAGRRCFDKQGHRVDRPSPDRILVHNHSSEDEAIAAEIELIAFYGRIDLGTGCLSNLTDGGEGISNISESTRSKMRANLLGTARHLGFKHSDESKLRMREVKLGNTYCVGYKHTQETRINMGNASRGRKHTPESKAKLSVANIGNKHNLGRKATLATRSKMSDSQRLRRAQQVVKA